jgi:SAM-dependent methyltransferase
MIKVLQDWIEIGGANKFLSRKGLPRHSSAEKNWDLYQLYTVVESMPRGLNIIDLGCGELMALKFLYAMGFTKLYGIDLSVSWRSRLSQVIRMWRNHSLKFPFHLYEGNLTETNFFDRMFDLAICISVLEHGVDLEDFFAESRRILKADGLLFITTDYWEEEIKVDDNKPFGLPWKVFSKKDIEGFTKLSCEFGFSLYKDFSIPACSDRCIVWNNHEYTSLCMVLRKHENERKRCD